MNIILSPSLVLREIAEAASIQIAEILKVDLSAVKVQFELMEDGRLIPGFAVDRDQARGILAGQIREVISAVYSDMKGLLSTRLQDLPTTWADCHERKYEAEKEVRATSGESAP